MLSVRPFSWQGIVNKNNAVLFSIFSIGKEELFSAFSNT